MQIAEHHIRQGVSGSQSFCDQLKNVILDNGFTKVIETGTHHGNGTTRAIVDALVYQNKPFEFYSIEVNPQNHKIASRNIGSINGVHLINGLSVSKALIPTSSTFNVPDYIFIDHEDANREDLYYKEVMFYVPDCQLKIAIEKLGHPELIVLDSAGHMGWIEFVYMMEHAKSPFIVALDDTFHVKHYHTMEYIRQNEKGFEILWEVESEIMNAQSGSKFGSAIIKVL